MFLLKMKLAHLLLILHQHELLIRNQADRDPLSCTVTQFELSSPEAKGAILFHCPLVMKGENQIERLLTELWIFRQSRSGQCFYRNSIVFAWCPMIEFILKYSLSGKPGNAYFH
jgi:hypothetical protein